MVKREKSGQKQGGEGRREGGREGGRESTNLHDGDVFLAGEEGQVHEAQDEEEANVEKEGHLLDLKVGLEEGREGRREGCE